MRCFERTLIIEDTHEEDRQKDLPNAGIGDNIDKVLEVLGKVDASNLGRAGEHGGEALGGIGTDGGGGVHGG